MNKEVLFTALVIKHLISIRHFPTGSTRIGVLISWWALSLLTTARPLVSHPISLHHFQVNLSAGPEIQQGISIVTDLDRKGWGLSWPLGPYFFICKRNSIPKIRSRAALQSSAGFGVLNSTLDLGVEKNYQGSAEMKLEILKNERVWRIRRGMGNSPKEQSGVQRRACSAPASYSEPSVALSHAAHMLHRCSTQGSSQVSGPKEPLL